GRRAGPVGDRLRRGRALPPQPLRPDRRRAGAEGRARMHRPVPPRGRAGTARRPLSLRPLPGARRVSEPMSQIEAVRKAWDAVERGDMEGLRALAAEAVHPDCEWTPLLAGVDGRTYHGPEGMVAFFSEWLDAFSPRYEDRDFEQLSDDVVLATCRLSIE